MKKTIQDSSKVTITEDDIERDDPEVDAEVARLVKLEDARIAKELCDLLDNRRS